MPGGLFLRPFLNVPRAVAAIAIATLLPTAAPRAEPPTGTGVECLDGIARALDEIPNVNGVAAIEGEWPLDGELRTGTFVYERTGRIRFFADRDPMEFMGHSASDLPESLNLESGGTDATDPRPRALLRSHLVSRLEELRLNLVELAPVPQPSPDGPASAPEAPEPRGPAHPPRTAPAEALTLEQLQLAAWIELEELRRVAQTAELDDDQRDSVAVLEDGFSSYSPDRIEDLQRRAARLSPEERADLLRRKGISYAGGQTSGGAEIDADSDERGDYYRQVNEDAQNVAPGLDRLIGDVNEALEHESWDDTNEPSAPTARDPASLRRTVDACLGLKGDAEIEQLLERIRTALGTAAPATGAGSEPARIRKTPGAAPAR